MRSKNAAPRVVILTGAGKVVLRRNGSGRLYSAIGQHSADGKSGRLASASRICFGQDLQLSQAAHCGGEWSRPLAGGCGIATLCDFTLAVPEAKFGYTEVKIGFLPAIVSVFLRRQIGEKSARDLLLTGRIIEAGEAQRDGTGDRDGSRRKLMRPRARIRRYIACGKPHAASLARSACCLDTKKLPGGATLNGRCGRTPRIRSHRRFPRRAFRVSRKARAPMAGPVSTDYQGTGVYRHTE